MSLLRAFLGRVPLSVNALMVLGLAGVAEPLRAEVVTITPANVNDYLSADALTRGWIEGCPSDSASPSGLCAGSVTDPEGGEGAILLSVANEYVTAADEGNCIGRETTLGVSNFRGVSRMSFESAQVQVDDLADLVGDGSNPYQIVYHYRLADGSVNQGSDWVRLKIKGPGQLGKVLFIENKPAGVETPVGNGWIRVDLSDPNLAWRWSGGLPSDDKPLSAWVSQFVAEDKRTGIQELLLDIGSNDLGLEACTYDGPRPNPDNPRKAPSEPTVKYGFYLDYLTLKPANAPEAKQVNFQLGAAPPSFDVSLAHIFTVDRVVTKAKVSQYLANGGDVEGFSIDEDDAGTYEVRGIFDWSRYAGASGDKFSSGCVNLGSPDPFVDGLISVEQFGKNSTTGKVNQINTGESAFWCMKNLKGGAGFESLDTSNLTTFYEMFRNANRFEGAVGGFDTSNVTNFGFAFDDARLFNTDITGWDTEAATNMYQMFTGATAFNQPIGSWTTDSVTNMGNMFQNATAFNQPIGNWDVSSVAPAEACTPKPDDKNPGDSWPGKYNCNAGMSGMFALATSFNQDLSAWNVAAFGGSEPQPNSQGQEFDAGANAWDGINPDTGVAWCNKGQPQWGTDGAECVLPRCNEVTESEWALASTDPLWVCRIDGDPYEYADFHILTTINNPPEVCANSKLPTADNNGAGLFCQHTGTTVRAIFDWENVEDPPESEIAKHTEALSWADSIDQIGSLGIDGECAAPTISGRCPRQIKTGRGAFKYIQGAGGAGIENLDTSNLSDLSEMFFGARALSVDLSNWDTDNFKVFYRLFQRTSGSVEGLNLWDVGGVEDMRAVFADTAFNDDISMWDTGSVTQMKFMFSKARAFNRDLSGWNVVNIATKPSNFGSGADAWTGIDAQGLTWCNKGQPQWGTDGAKCLNSCEIADWSVVESSQANKDAFQCTVDGDQYEYADFHILTTIDTPPAVCSQNKLPTADNNGAGLFCQQNDKNVRALFDWGWGNNSEGCSHEALQDKPGTEDCLHWLQSVSQFGSRAAGTGETSGLTVSGRVPNQLATGDYAFARFAGEGGSGFQSLDTSNLTSLRYAFARAKNFDEDISAWNTAQVSNLNRVFWGSGFNRAIPTNGSAWDVSRVHNFAAAFANSAFDQDLSSWDVGKASSFLNMFINNIHFNQNLSAWADKLTELTTMENMFKAASAFNNGAAPGTSGQPLNWGAAPKLQRMNYAFANATSFNQRIFADGASTASVENMSGMFKAATAFNQDIGDWNTQSLQKAASMFEGATAFNQDIGSWSVDSLTNMNAMFRNAKAFNQDLSGWAIGKPAIDFSSFDEGADAWCGLGFSNRGRPGTVSPSEAESCALSLVIDAPDSAVAGGQFDYVLRYYNESSTDFDTGTLSLTLPSGLSVVDAGAGTATGQTVSWTGLTVPAGSSSDSGGGEQSVTVKVDAGVSDGAALEASATLTDGADTSVNDIATVTVTSQAMLDMDIYRGDGGGDDVLPGETILYTVVPKNTGLSPTEGGQLTISWSGGVPFAIESNNGATCTDTRCDLALEIDAGKKAWTSFQIRVGADAQAGGVLTATASMTATNAEPSITASIGTEVRALPLPELKIDVATQPQGVVDLGSQFTALVDLSNTGTGTAASTTATVDIGSAMYVGAAVGDAPSYDSNSNAVTWIVDKLEPSELKVLSVLLKAPQQEGAVILKSEASTTTSAGNVINDTDEQSLSVTGTAVLDLQLGLDPNEQLLPGDALDMAFSFQNVGNSSALDAVLDTETPSDTTLLRWPDYATCAGDDCSEGYTGAISLNLGTVFAKENAVTSLSVLVNETAEEQTLSVWGSLNGKNTAGDALPTQAAAKSVRVAASTDDVLTVNQRADRQTVAPGQVVVYEITYQNLSNEAVTNATLTDVLPKDTRLLNQTGGTVTIDPETQETTWQLTPIELAPLAKGTALLQVEVAGNAETGTSLNNTVSLSTADSTVWANNAEVTVVANGAVLESSISNPEATAPGDSFTYALRFANTGTLAAANTTLQMQVENVVSVTDCDGCSESDDGRLSWSLGSIAKGTDQTKQITVQVDPGVAANSELYAISYISDSQSAGAVGAGAQLTAQQQRRRGGSASANQATSAAERAGPLGLSTIRVGEKASPALGGLRMIVPEQVVAGDQVAVTVTFGNTGGAPATGVTLTSRVPANSTLSSIEGGSCSSDLCIAGETLTWNVGEVAAASTREVSYSLTSDSASAGSVIGHQVTLDSAESRATSASANTDIVAEKLSVAIAVTDAAGNDAEGSIVGVGDKLTYTLTLLNNSPTARSGITVVNQVPQAIAACGQACIGGDSGGAAIDAEAGTLTWSNFDLDAGAEVALDYQVTIPTGLENNTKLINNVSVNTAARFSDSALSTVTVATQAELALSMTAPDVLQDGARGAVTMSYQNTGTAATAATLRYVLPNNAIMIDSDNAAVSGSAYTWNLGDVSVEGSGSRTVAIEVSGEAGSSLLHTASVTGTDAGDKAEATTVIGLREELALSLTAPGSVNTGDGFIASLTAQNTGNAAATATALSLTLPAGFTVSALDGGTLDNQVVRWNVELAAGASVTRSPTLKAPAAAGNAVLLAGLTATSGKTQSASAAVQVTMAASPIITAGAQFSVAEAKAGDSVTLTAGPVNVGDGASGAISNTVVLSSGLTATAYDDASWNAGTRTLSWTTNSLPSEGSDPKNFTVRVEDAGELTATASSNGAEGVASMVRTFPEDVIITPENSDSTCKLSGQPTVQAAPTPPSGVTLAFANTVGFKVIDCDRSPNASYPETLSVTIDVGQAIDSDARLYKISDAGQWSIISGAVISGQTVTYSLTDDGDLDQDKTPGTLRAPVALAVPPPEKPPIPVLLPLWLLAALMGSVGWMGYRRLRLA